MKLRMPIRLAVFALLLAALTALAVSAADCGDTHAWDAGKIVWNEDYTAAEGIWTCTVCGDTKTAGADIFDKQTNPTCTEPGSVRLTAYAKLDNKTACSDSREIPLSQLEHTYTEPTFLWNTVDFKCQASWGCTLCGETETADCDVTESSYAAVGHTPGGTVYTAYINVGGKDYADTRKVAGDPIGHDYSTPVFTWSDDYLSARVESICSVCALDDPERILRTDCSITRRIEEADCFSDGYSEYIARADLLGQVWEDTKTVIYARLQHKYPTPTFLWEGDECTVACACEYCETEYPADCVIRETETYADCTTPGILTRTATITVEGITYSDSAEEEIPAKGHTQVRISGRAATCTESGLTEGIGCAVCEVILQKQTVIPAPGHSDAVVKGSNATCTEAGWTDRIFCTVCKEVLQKSTVIAAKGHTEKTVAGYAPTCTEEGRGDGVFCTVCRQVLTEQNIIPVVGHTAIKLDARAVTCTEDGCSEGVMCSVCDEVLVKQTIFRAKGHTIQKLNGRAASCTEDGLTNGEICTVCREVIKEQIVIPAKGHTPEKQDLRPPTCTEPGYGEGNTCAVCHIEFRKPGVIPAEGHKPKTIDGWKATCTEDGISDGSICSVCEIVLEKQTVIPATGHTPETKKGLAPTCDDAGRTEGVICSVCDVVLEEAEPIPALGHTWTQPVFTWSDTNESAKAEKICETCEIIYSAVAHVQAKEILENGTLVTQITANVIFADGTTASDVKKIVPDPVLPDPEPPVNPPVDEPDSESKPDPEPEPNPEQTPDHEPTVPEPEPANPEPEPNVLQFDDVASDSYYYDAVMWAAGMKITQGTADGIFSPDMVCSRAQVVTMLWRAAGSPVLDDVLTFRDVPKTAYYYDAVVWAFRMGITSGTSETTFSPELQCSRAQIVTMIWRAAGCPDAKMTETFSDVAPDGWYGESVAWAVQQGITLGTGKNQFAPDAVCTRAQIVTFLYRARHEL